MANNIFDTPDTTSNYEKADIENNMIMALLSYIGILWLVPMFAAKESKYAQFHVNQGILLTIVGVIVGVASAILAFIPIVGGLIGAILAIVPFALMVLGIINVVQGKAKELPFIGGYRILK